MLMIKIRRKTKSRKLKPLLLTSALLLILIFIFSLSASLSEWYIRTIYPIFAGILSFISGIVPFSVYDVFLILGILLYLKLIVWVILRKNSFRDFIYSVVRLTILLIAWFYFAWGIAYFRKDFNTRCNIPKTEFKSENFKEFAVRFVEDANRSYTDCDEINKESIRLEIELSYNIQHSLLKIGYPNGKRRPKPMMFESVYSKMGVSGYFGPFFNEIHVNNYVMNFDYPFTLAHEMAHQFGVALESEANLYAFVVCVGSENPIIKYSAYNSVLNYVLNDVYLFLPNDFEKIRGMIRPEIIADMKQNRAHWLAARNKTLSDTQSKVYDAYLKTNKISSGHENYSEVVGLIVSVYDRIEK